ncbi:hypothetical protein B9037_006065 [Klebsiella aerogenes]|uniref:HEPN domain-containing protein n=1 Tax=Klebsiella aerogenes TaxID=548 RepID=UPI000B40CF70|nr:HEPN domain-containing protein [Klebsiella aerogenes]MEB7635980.1 HEPN domain-containing protein [Klebsiella aerogenes]RNT35300.1 hypothetical protein B9037_006065 [Klebsiella aerogenes]HDS4948016.1 hypothetical protein [Klebsiella aerogenes]
MSYSKDISSRIFKSCTLNKSTIEKIIFSHDGLIGNVIIITDNESFEKGLDDLSKTNDGQFISKIYFRYYIEKTLFECGDHPDDDIDVRVKYFKNLINSLSLVKQTEHRVVKQVFGGNIKNGSHPINLGPFCFYEIPRHASHIKLPFSDPFFSKQQPTKTVVQLCVKSLDSYKASEIADTFFNTLELSFSFLLAKKGKEFSIGAFMYEFSPTEPPIIYTEGSIFGRTENKHEQDQIIDLADLTDYFPEKKASSMTNFFNVVLSPGTQLERKLSRAVEWIGEAYRDKNRSSALLKVVIALEALFKVNERSVITASIVASMAEQCAYISGESVDECLEIEDYVKELYGLRSKVVHAGSNNLGENELKKALTFSRSIIFKLIDLKINEKFESIDELQPKIRESKYKSCPLWQTTN